MIPNIHMHEQLLFERAQERQREIEQRHLLAGLRKPRRSVLRHTIGNLGTFFVALGTRMKQVAQSGVHSIANCNEMVHGLRGTEDFFVGSRCWSERFSQGETLADAKSATGGRPTGTYPRTGDRHADHRTSVT